MEVTVRKYLDSLLYNGFSTDEVCKIDGDIFRYDELYNQKYIGQITLNRDPVTYRFLFWMFIDIDAMELSASLFREVAFCAKTLVSLRHPNLLALHNVSMLSHQDSTGEERKFFCFTMEAPDHVQNWKSFCRRLFTPLQILCIFRELCTGLDYLHSQRIILRDLHPTRISQVNGVTKINLLGMPYNF
jgi:serine/threonine protein kinase